MKSVGLMAEREKPTSEVPARRSFASFGSPCFHTLKRMPSAVRMRAVIPRETGTTSGWLPRSDVKPQKATPA